MNDHGRFDEMTTESGSAGQTGAWFDVLPVALVGIDRGGRIVQWGMTAQELLGYSAGQVLGRDGLEMMVPAADRSAVRSLLETVASGHSALGSFMVRHINGPLLELEAWLCPVPDRDRHGPGILLFATEAAHARQARGTQALVDGLFTRSPVGLAVFDTELRFQQVNPALEAMNGVPSASHVGRRLGQVLPGVNTDQMEAAMRRVLETGDPILDFRRIGRTPADPDHDRVWTISYFRLEDVQGRPLGVSASIIDVTAHHAADLGTEAGRRRLDLLNEAAIRIGTTLDMERTAQELADVAVPRLADVVTVDLLEIVVEGAEPGAGLAHGAALRRMGMAPAAESPVAAALAPVGRTLIFPAAASYVQPLMDRRPFVLARIDAHAIAPAADYADTAERLLRMGVHSMMAVPLIVRGLVLGIATFYRAGQGAPFDAADGSLAHDLATRAAVRLDNARLYSREHDTALTLQRSMLPQRLRPPDGIEIAHRYLPASDVNEVGGDWYDVVPLGPGKAALVIGDVMGHGIPAAAVMGQLSSSVRALARLDLPPAQLLQHLDVAMQELEDPLLATCVYGVYDAHAGRCWIARAGHPPPAVVAPDGTVRLLDLPPGAPLGIGGIDFTTTEVPLAAGSLLVLYTDGLIEARGRDLDQGLAELTRLLAEVDQPVTELCDILISRLTSGPIEDDIAVLIARIGHLQGEPSE